MTLHVSKEAVTTFTLEKVILTDASVPESVSLVAFRSTVVTDDVGTLRCSPVATSQRGDHFRFGRTGLAQCHTITRRTLRGDSR